MTIAEPAGNAAPGPGDQRAVVRGLTCNFSAVGTVDPNTGDTITYSWNFGDPASRRQQPCAGSATSHVFTVGGTYTVDADGHGRVGQARRRRHTEVTVTAPPTP